MNIFTIFSFILLGFIPSIVIFVRLGFLFGITINSYSLVASLLVYTSLLFILLSALFKQIPGKSILAIVLFIGTCFGMYYVSLIFGKTYDLSWDGQGYHQSAVIALSDGWNPIYEKHIKFKQELPSQIFAEGYPSALWEIQASIVSSTGKVNSGKITNLYSALVAGCLLFILLRSIRLGPFFSGLTSMLAVTQPVFAIQMLTYMQDGFGYHLLIMTLCAFILFILKPTSLWPMLAFIFSEMLLITTKYSHLPVALLFGGLFLLVLLNRVLNKEIVLSRFPKYVYAALIIIMMMLFYLPYGRNLLFYRYPFFPTNIPELMGSVTYNNVPQNLAGSSKIALLFYGVFSRSQFETSGDPTHETNIAVLKPPFLFTLTEIRDSAGLFNNRVGAGGPLYSGILVLTVATLIGFTIKARTALERYTVYGIYALLGLFIATALLSPVPNLFRYVHQLQLVPFSIIIPLYAVIRNHHMQYISYLTIILIAVNTVLYMAGVLENNVNQIGEMNAQFSSMRNSKKTYVLRAQQFYSNYILTSEQGIPFRITQTLTCSKPLRFPASSNTTHYCIE